jgi:hypothetical protein
VVRQKRRRSKLAQTRDRHRVGLGLFDSGRYDFYEDFETGVGPGWGYLVR